MGARLYTEESRRMLWLSGKRSDLAVWADGLLVRRRRAQVELGWAQVTQVQVSPVPLWPRRAWIDVFAPTTEHRAGPFPRDKARMWAAASAGAARDAGWTTLPLAQSDGFAMAPRTMLT